MRRINKAIAVDILMLCVGFAMFAFCSMVLVAEMDKNFIGLMLVFAVFILLGVFFLFDDIRERDIK